MSTTWSGPEHWIPAALPVQAARAVLSWTDHRVPAAVTEVFSPRASDDGTQRLRPHMLQPGPEAS